MATRTPRGFGQYSGVARALERVGERWALLIVRDLLSGARRYGDLKAALPRIPTNILSDRLKELQASGVIRRVPTVRGGYELTPFGRQLEPVVLALERWGWAVLGDPAPGEGVSHDALAASLRVAFRQPDAAGEPPTEYVLHVGGVSVAAVVVDGDLTVAPVGPGALPQPRHGPDAAVTPSGRAEFELTDTQFRDLLSGTLDPASVRGTSSDGRAVHRFLRTFRIDPPAEP